MNKEKEQKTEEGKRPMREFRNAKKDKLQIKVVLLGDMETGKTSFVDKYTEKVFNDEYKKSYGGMITNFIIDKFQIYFWDISGCSDINHSENTFYFEDSELCMIFYDGVNENSYDNVTEYLNVFKKYSPKSPIVILETKNDLNRNISEEKYKLLFEYTPHVYKISNKNENDVNNIVIGIKNILLDIFK